jgi:hypothetical protein
VGGSDVSGGKGGRNNVKLHLTRTVFEGEEWLHLVHNKNQRHDLANTAVNLNAVWKAISYWPAEIHSICPKWLSWSQFVGTQNTTAALTSAAVVFRVPCTAQNVAK